MLSNVARAIFAILTIAVMSMALAGCGHQGELKDPWHSNPPAISRDGEIAVIEPDDAMDPGIVKAPDYESLPGDVLAPSGDIDYR